MVINAFHKYRTDDKIENYKGEQYTDICAFLMNQNAH